MTETYIEAASLSKTYRSGFLQKKEYQALTELNLSLGAGEILAFLGPNGAGKTTTINLLMGFLKPSAGSVKLFGMDPEERSVRKKLGYLPENYAFYSYMSAVNILEYFADLLNLTKSERSERIDKLLHQLELWEARNRPVGSYSRGMKQRLGIIQALLNKPSLLILDEPTSGFDPTGRKMVKDLLLELRQSGTSILLSSHILSEVESVCDRVMIINKGKMVRQGTLKDILSGKSFEIHYEDPDGLIEGKVAALGLKPVRSSRYNSIVTDSEETAQKLVRLVVESGAKLEALIPKVETLEEVFIATVGAGEGGTSPQITASQDTAGGDK